MKLIAINAKLCALFMFFTQSSQAMADCQIVSDTPYQTLKSGLTPLWAQEYIGADLAKELIGEIPSPYRTRVGNFDGGYSQRDVLGAYEASAFNFFQNPTGGTSYIDHGTKTANIINSSPFGVGQNTVLSHLYDIQDYPFVNVTNKFLENPGDILNLEIHTLCVLNFQGICAISGRKYGGLEAIKSSLRKLSTKTIVVAAAGNFSATYNRLVNWPMITVASIQPNGDISTFSNRSPDITILAPSDNYLHSYGLNGDPKFGGTSGAAPLVSGSIANVISLLGPTNIQNILQLLQKTAIPLPINRTEPLINGYGMVNAYKLVRLAKLGTATPENEMLLHNESNQLLTTGLAQLEDTECSVQRLGFLNLRKSFLLNPTEAASDRLAQIYEADGFYENASFYAAWQ